jgi:hypothetical protein
MICVFFNIWVYQAKLDLMKKNKKSNNYVILITRLFRLIEVVQRNKNPLEICNLSSLQSIFRDNQIMTQKVQ